MVEATSGLSATLGDPPVAAKRRATSPLRRVGLGEAVADLLRGQILAGDFADRQVLPPQNDLVREFSVPKAAVREALRILEVEGMVTVRRGNVGGAVVHTPSPEGAAYMLGLVLQARTVSYLDVRLALRQLEPACAGLCAGRPDRAEVVVPLLLAVHAELLDSLAASDLEATSLAARHFHEALVSACGNETLTILVGTLEAIWSAHAEQSAAEARAAGESPLPSLVADVAAAHGEMIACIERGEIDAVSQLARSHVDTARLYPGELDASRLVEASDLRGAPY